MIAAINLGLGEIAIILFIVLMFLIIIGRR